ncbi:MAG: Endonuclease III, partial [uncultured Nocardioides sp.]
ACRDPDLPLRPAASRHHRRTPRPQGRPHPGRDLPRRAVRARLRRPVRAAGRHGALGADHRPAGQHRPACDLRRLPRRPGDGRRPARAPRAAGGAAGLLPREDGVAAEAERRPRGAPRRRGPAPARGPGEAAGRGPQDRQRRPRQRLRHPRHHRGHPLRPPRAPLRLDRGDRSGEGRAHRRRPLPPSRLDHAVAPPHLARPAHLPCQEAGLRCLPGRPSLPVLRRGPDRPRRRAGAGQDAGPGV